MNTVATILFVMFLSPFTDKDGTIIGTYVSSSHVVEFANVESCHNAAKGHQQASIAGSYKVITMCAPKAVAKLEVLPKKNAAPPSDESPRIDGSRA